MDNLTARPGILKQANQSYIRRVLRTKGTATRAELVRETGISPTTVRALLSGMLENGEIESMGSDPSSGGRKAERYRFRPERYHGAAICMSVDRVDGLVINQCGEIVEYERLPCPDGDLERSALAYLDAQAERRELRAVGVGGLGVVDGRCFWRKDRAADALYKVEIGETIARRYGLPVVLENDLNATAIGLARCYGREFPGERPEDTNLAYLHFDKGCISAGFIAGGRVLRGWNNFAGELGLIPVEEGRPLDECMIGAADDGAYTQRLLGILCWICGVLNPQYVALGGPDLRKDCLGPVGDGLFALLPKQMQAEILYVPDVWHDYRDGMAWLTAGRMFDEVQLVRE